MAANKDKIKDELSEILKEYMSREQVLLDKLSKKDREAIGHPIKDISLLDKFEANGNTYIIRTSLPLDKFEAFEEAQVQAGYGLDFKQLFGNMRKSFDYLNESQPADAAIILYNMMNGIKDKLDGRTNEVLQICCLFICRKDENVAKYDPDLNELKIKDWKEEGINTESFFSLAFSLVNGFTPIYREISGSISENLANVRNDVKNEKLKRDTSTDSETI